MRARWAAIWGIFTGVLFISPGLLAYEQSMCNLTVPTGLESGEGEFRLIHRFYGKIFDDPFDEPFESLGTNQGVNVDIGFRYQILPRAELSLSYGTDWREVALGASYAVYIPTAFLRSQADVRIFSYEPGGSDDRGIHVFGQLSLQSEPFLQRISPVLNVGYDGDTGRAGLGLGINLIIIRRLEILGEYFPLLYDEGAFGGENDFYAFGVKLNTSGHHFFFLLSNSLQIGSRFLMQGTMDHDLRLGFTIHRIFES